MNKLALPILAVLSDGKFHSGEALAQQFGVTRATIFNAVREAQTYGVTIFSVHGRGYRLPHPIKLLDQTEIMQAIGEHAAWFHLLVLAQVDSTNRYLMQESVRGIAHGTCVVAMMQTAGRGRRGRQWLSKLGGSLTFSLLWRFSCGAAGLTGLSLVVGLALVRALQAMDFVAVKLKWPNDIVVLIHGQWHKLGGILIELQGDMEGPSAAVIGIGLNLTVDDTMQQQIAQPSIGLHQLLSQLIDPNHLLGRCLQQLAVDLNTFSEFGFEPFKAAWLAQHAYQQQAVQIHLNNGNIQTGKAVDVQTDGSLLVETAEGLIAFHSGEISLRGAA